VARHGAIQRAGRCWNMRFKRAGVGLSQTDSGAICEAEKAIKMAWHGATATFKLLGSQDGANRVASPLAALLTSDHRDHTLNS
jgi:hypothetical protein